MVRRGEPVQAYNEAAFRYFLTVDRRRAEHWMRSLLLVLVGVRTSPGRNAKLSDATAAALFVGLRECCRGVDLVGWYKQRRIAAAVLVQGVQITADVRRLIAARVLSALKKRLSADQSAGLRVRVIPLGIGPSDEPL